MTPPPEPTTEQCEKLAPIAWIENRTQRQHRGFAIWYPQMGGYVGRAVVEGCDNANAGEPAHAQCFDVWVWHDGAFPFSEGDGRDPYFLHHCRAQQFVDFGEQVKKALGDLVAR